MPINMGDQFKGLPMADLIGAPLQAACDAQVNLARATANFIQTVGFVQPTAPADGTSAPANSPATQASAQVRQVDFKFSRPRALIGTETTPDPVAGTTTSSPMEEVTLSVPLLAIVKIPALAINTVDITFDMEVKNSESSTESSDTKGGFAADASVGWGPFSLKVHVEGSVATHKENTRQTDQSAKYHVEVHAEDKGMPEGLARVLDMMNSAIAPTTVTPQVIAAPTGGGGGGGSVVQPNNPVVGLAGPAHQHAGTFGVERQGATVVGRRENETQARVYREVQP